MRTTRNNPLGLQIIIITIISPKTSTLKSEKALKISGIIVNKIAAITTPGIEPKPPKTTMATMSADSKKLKELGLIKPCKAPKKTPANH